MKISRMVVAGILWGPSAYAADSIGTLTIVDGPVEVVQEMHRAEGVAGMQLAPDAIVETGPNAFVQIETTNGVKVDLGPDTRLLTSTSSTAGASLLKGGFLLSGWLKVAGADVASASLANPYFEVDSIEGTLVEYVTGEYAGTFTETGKARVTDFRSHTTVDLAPTRSYAQRKGEAGRSAAGAALLGAPPPVAFRDTLPLLWRKFDPAKAPTVTIGEFNYAQVRDWLVVDAPVRLQFARLWRGKAASAEFKSGLVADMNAHPEWQDILFPPLKVDNAGRAGTTPPNNEPRR